MRRVMGTEMMAENVPGCPRGQRAELDALFEEAFYRGVAVLLSVGLVLAVLGVP